MIGFRQLREQPFHFVLLQGHIDFNGGVAGNRRGYTCTDFLQIQRLLFARKLIQDFVQQVFDRARVYARRGDFYGHAARTERFGFESITGQFIGNFAEHSLLGWSQFKHDRHQ